MVAGGQPQSPDRPFPQQRCLIRRTGAEAPPALHWRPARGGGQQGIDARLELALARRGEALTETRFRFARGPHHQQSVLAGHQIGAGAEHHPAEGSDRSLQREHLPLHWKHRKPRQQLGAPGAAAEHRLAAGEGELLAVGPPQAHRRQLLARRFTRLLPLRFRDQPQHFAALLESHTPVHAGPLQGPHQTAAVVDLSVLGEQQARPPERPDPGDLPLQAGAIQPLAVGRGWVGIPFGGAGEGHHNPADPQAAGQAAIGFDPRHPGGDPLQAALS